MSAYAEQQQYDYSANRPYSPGALELLNATRRPGAPPVQGYTDVRVRDQVQYEEEDPSMSSPDRSRSAPAAAGERLIKFESTRSNAIRPVVFRPNGSFKALKENGKLSCGPMDRAFEKGRGRNPDAESAHFMPGYTGFVRGSQHISGRTYGETTRRALTTDYRDVVCTSPIPSDPQANRKVKCEQLKDTFVANLFGNRTYHVPGYTGFVPGVRATYAKCYGSATQQELLSLSERHPERTSRHEPEGFATTSKTRKPMQLSSNPLPGGSETHDPPVMYIPATIKYLRYFQM